MLAVAAGVVLAVAIGLVVFGQGALAKAYQNRSAFSSLALAPVALALAFLWALWLAFGKGRRADRRDTALLAVWQLILLAAQLLAARSLWFYAGWDVECVYTAAEELARTGATTYADYFAMCPNNAPLTALLAAPLWLGVKLGLAVPYAALPYLCACAHNLTCLLTALCVRRLTDSRRALWAAVGALTVWIGLHLYMTVPYTDVFSAFFAALALYILLSRLPLFAKGALFTFVCFFGASCKQTVLILFIAAAALGAGRMLRRGPKGAEWRRRALTLLAAAIVGFLPAKLWQDATTRWLAGSVVPEEQLSAAHYLMIGQNGDTMGGHSGTDLEYSQSFPTLAEREQANLQTAWERISGRSLAQSLRFYAVKLFKAYGDGTFGANMSLLEQEIPRRSDALTAALRSVFYARGKLNPYYCAVEQAVWLALLTLCVCACFLARKRPAVALLALTLLGVTGYQLLFEVWPRYLFLYAPAYLALAAMGAEAVGGRIAGLARKRRGARG